MDTKEYIASGILESYAMGLSSVQESSEVECLISIYPELKAELNNIQLSLETYANSLAVSAPEGSKQKILTAIKELEQEPVLTNASENKPLEDVSLKEDPAGKVIKLKSYLKLAVASAILLLFGFGYVFNQLQTDYSSLEGELLTYQKQTDQQINQIEDSLLQTIEERSFLLAEGTEIILLAGTELSPNSKVMLFWNREKKEYVVQYNKLAKAEKGKQYQLWAIAGGKPFNMGVLNESEQSTDKKAIQLENIQAFAITLEKEGGSEAPTLEAMYVIGNV